MSEQSKPVLPGLTRGAQASVTIMDDLLRSQMLRHCHSIEAAIVNPKYPTPIIDCPGWGKL